jgi:ornithine cyclodeaminase/alanine dehydrogenase-like protein (mu-crystallin family)
MSVEVVLAALKADAGVTAIVGSGVNARISALMKTQGITIPAVTLQRISLEPQNHLRGHAGLDSVRVQVDSWEHTYAGVRALADACRSALQDADHVMLGEIDNYDPETDPGLYRITQDFQIWI